MTNIMKKEGLELGVEANRSGPARSVGVWKRRVEREAKRLKENERDLPNI